MLSAHAAVPDSGDIPLFLRLAQKLGSALMRSDGDVARLVEQRLPLTSLDSLSKHGVSDEEIFMYVLPRRTLAHRRSRHEPLTHEESDRAVRLARIASLAEEVFGVNRNSALTAERRSRCCGPKPALGLSRSYCCSLISAWSLDG